MEVEYGYRIKIDSHICACCGTKFIERMFGIPLEVLLIILTNTGKVSLLLSKRIGKILTPMIFPSIISSFKPQTSRYVIQCYRGNFPTFDGAIFSNKKCVFSLYYSFDPHDSDTYWLNVDNDRKTPNMSRDDAYIPCPIEKYAMMLERKKYVENLFECEIPLDKIKENCHKEVIDTISGTNRHSSIKLTCYIILVAMGLNVPIRRFLGTDKNCSSSCHEISNIPVIKYFGEYLGIS